MGPRYEPGSRSGQGQLWRVQSRCSDAWPRPILQNWQAIQCGPVRFGQKIAKICLISVQTPQVVIDGRYKYGTGDWIWIWIWKCCSRLIKLIKNSGQIEHPRFWTQQRSCICEHDKWWGSEAHNAERHGKCEIKSKYAPSQQYKWWNFVWLWR